MLTTPMVPFTPDRMWTRYEPVIGSFTHRRCEIFHSFFVTGSEQNKSFSLLASDADLERIELLACIQVILADE